MQHVKLQVVRGTVIARLRHDTSQSKRGKECYSKNCFADDFRPATVTLFMSNSECKFKNIIVAIV